MQKIIIYTDGSSRGNPGPGGWGAIVVIENKSEDKAKAKDKVWELGGRDPKTTNNRMEMQAVIGALSFVVSNLKDSSKSGSTSFDKTQDKLLTTDDKSHLEVHTDSAYLINGITKWVHGWQKNDWKTKTKDPVLNKDLWQQMVDAVEEVGIEISWKKVSGHSGHEANERCDEIATSFADGAPVTLFSGPKSEYKIDFEKVGNGKNESKSSKSKNNKGKAYAYISLLDGKVVRHSSWPECESRVKGKSGAKFKKVFSEEEAKELEEKYLGM